jgi:AAA family ATP:ADP antiporter
MRAKVKKVFSDLIPIKAHEVRKFLPMFIVFFFVGFIYNILRNAKDALLVTGQESGAQIIPFVKVWVMLPGAILMTGLFSWLSNKFNMEKVFYIIVSIFISYFVIFTFVIYPNRELMHLQNVGTYLEGVLPMGCLGFISMIKYWSFTLFYVMAELWSCIVLSLLFWGFANEVTPVSEAKRFYGLFGIGMNFSGIAAGQAAKYFSKLPIPSKLLQDQWQQSLIWMTLLILISGLLMLTFFRWLNVNVLTNDKFYKPKKKYKLSIRKNFAYLAKSKYLICIALLVLAFNLVINLVEILWKDQIRTLYPNPNDYNIYLNNITVITGIIATLMALFSGVIIRTFGWTMAAIITPLILFITSIGFFACFFWGGSLNSIVTTYLGMSPLALVVFFGSTQICLSRACKYTVFDATKELSFIPLSPESRQKGKAAIDGVGSRLGKSGGSLIHQGLLMVFSSFALSAPYVAGVLFAVILAWIGAVKVLGKEFNTLINDHETLEIQDEAKEAANASAAKQPV